MAEFDILITGSTVIDGTGAAGRPADVAVANGQIAALGDLSGGVARQVVDAAGRVVCPGFIDIHTHSDLTPFLDTRCSSKLRQGVTTELVGNCGFSAFPLATGTPRERAELDRAVFMATGVAANWSDCAGYLSAVDEAHFALNIATMVGNGTIRAKVMGYDNRPPSGEELKAMRREVAEAMEQGAIGFSTGLTLYPSSAARTDEIVELCEEAAQRGGIYNTHTRHLAGWHFKSVEEAVEIGRRAGIPVEVAHLALIDPRHWDEAEGLLGIIDGARAGGLDINFDVYPYLAAGCPFSESMPDWLQDGGTEAMLGRLADPATRRRVLDERDTTWASGIPMRFENVLIAACGPYGDPAWSGKTVAQLAGEAGVSSPEMMLDIVVRSRDIWLMIVFNRLEDDVEQLIAHPLGMIGSDGLSVTADGPWGRSPVHPRFYGTFPRVLAHYVREKGVVSLPEAIRKMTSLPASRIGLAGRGRLKPGFAADLVVFDPAAVQDRSTFDNPHCYAAGIPHVMVNGQWAVFDGEQTSARAGQALRRR